MPQTQHDTPFDLPAHLDERTVALNDRAVNEDAGFVLCWLHHAVRAHENPALDAAITLGNAIGRPVLVYQGLGGRHRFNSDRHHAFIMEGARDLQRDLRERGVAYAFHLPADPTAPSPIRALIDRACAVVAEDFPAPPFPDWANAHARRAGVAMVAVDSACLLPVRALDTKHTRAFKFRDAAKREWDRRLGVPWEDAAPTVEPLVTDGLGFEGVDLESADLDALIAACDIDHTVPSVAHTPGGSDAGYERWERFRREGLKRYANRRNDATDAHGVSRLSPYLHHGHVSPFRVAREADAVGGKGAEKFLDELLTWRELSYHFCAHSTTEELETLKAIPGWARDTLEDHASDERASMYTWEDLARARTGDELWDGAQRSLLWSGELHNNLRMTWGKMLPKWTPGPAEALRLLIDLNHRFALDGNNPNSYGGLLWCLGQFDRPFTPEQPVLGSVRPRDTGTHAKRLDPERYNAVVRASAAVEPLRVAVVGAGVAGLACARALRDQRCDVVVFDKGRGPGGRTSTRFTDDACFDHGAPWFDVTDPRFGRCVRSWVQRGVAAVWDGRFVDAEGAPLGSDGPRVVGTPGMNAVCAHLGADLGVRFGERVTGVERTGDGWALDTDGAPFDRLVLALPPTQALELLGDVSPEIAGRYGAIGVEPRWSLMLEIAGDAPEFDAMTPGDGVLELLVRDDAKPGRDSPEGRTLWVAHATGAWSDAHLEDDKEAVAARLGERVSALVPGEVTRRSAHRWRYARVATPIGERALWDAELALACCADGMGGSGVEGAFLSGQAAAGRVLASSTPIEAVDRAEATLF